MPDLSTPAPGSRRAANNTAYVRAAANVEAIRLGHPEVDMDHLLLALLITGGPSARLLLDAGVTLDRGRHAVAEVQQRELSDIGVDLPAPAPGPARYASASPLPLNGRARELDDRLPFAADDRALLTALINDEGGRVRRLLTQLGVDADALRQSADTTKPGPRTSTQPKRPELTQTDGLRPGGEMPPELGWLYVSHSQDVPVAANRVWALISDPERRAEWGVDCSAARVLADGSVELTRNNGTTVNQIVSRNNPGHDIAWQQLADNGQPVRSLHLTVEPSGNHSRLHLRLGWPHNTRGPLARRVTTWVASGQLRVQAQSIAQTSSA